MKVQIVGWEITPTRAAVIVRSVGEMGEITKVDLPMDKVLTKERLISEIKVALSQIENVTKRMRLLKDLRYEEIDLGEESNE